MSSGKRMGRWRKEVKDLLGIRPPDTRTTSLPSTRQPNPGLLPQNLPRSVTPLPGAGVSSAQADTRSHLLSPSSGTVPSQSIASTTSSVLSSPVPNSQPLMANPPAPPGSSQIVHPAEESSLGPPKSTAWAGLKTLLKVVHASTNVFPPLKSAVGGLHRCIEIFEVC